MAKAEWLLSPEQAKSALRDGRRFKRRRQGIENRVLIHYRGAWRLLGRTDLMDDVATGSCERLADPLQYYRERVVYGARVRPGMFHVIDSATDG